MAIIAATNVRTTATVTETVLGATDTFTYKSGVNQTLILRNGTAGALSPIIDGDGASTVNIAGAGSFDISAGYAVGSVGIGAVVSIRTDHIASFLQGVIAITGADGITATLLEN